MVKATLTSEVVIRSTEIPYLAKILKIFARKPQAPIMLGLCKVNRIWFFLKATALKVGLEAVSLRTHVPPFSGSFEEPTNTGMFLRTAGKIVAGCNTLAPKVAISAASEKVISGIA